MSRPPSRLAVACCLLAVLGLLAPAAAAPDREGPAGPADGAATQGDDLACEPNDDHPDPEEDVLGWEDGCWYDEPVDVDQDDGLGTAETAAYVGRTMARVERVRRLEFEESVPVDVISRERFREQEAAGGVSAEYAGFQNQLWEALFVVGEGENATDVETAESGATTLAYYSALEERIVVVTPDEEFATINNETLAHELVHVLQDQHFGLLSILLDARTTDEYRGNLGLTEGDAEYVTELYGARCGTTWDCVRDPEPPDGVDDVRPRPSPAVTGISVLQFQPYSDGPAFVHRLRESGGWAAVNDRYDAPPTTTEQVIHADRADDRPGQVPPESARDQWTRFGGSTDRLGELGVFTMFWFANWSAGIDTIPYGAFGVADGGAYDRFNYSSVPSEGWADDRFVPVRKGDQRGYVWTLEWDTARDAAEFRAAYLRLLAGHGAVERSSTSDRRSEAPTGPRSRSSGEPDSQARQGAIPRGGDVYVIEDGPFADAFLVRRRGTTVTVVNAPTVGDLDDVDPANGSGGNASEE